MRALTFDGSRLEVQQRPKPVSGGEALVRVLRSGICNTDLEIVRGYAAFTGVIGHEFVGVVEDCAGRPDILGKRVVGEINAGCGRCGRCLGGDPRHCPTRTVLGIVGRDGSHSEFLRLPAENLFVVPENITDDEAVFTEPLAAAFGITEQVDVQPETRVAVIGDGKLGLLCAMSLRLASDEVILVGKHVEKMEIAARCGVTPLILDDVGPDISGSFDVVVEASGSESGFATALDLVRPRGKIVLKSTFHGKPVWAASRVVVDEITIVGSRCGRFAPALELLSSGKVDVTPMISDILPLSRGVKAMESAARLGTLKVILDTRN